VTVLLGVAVAGVAAVVMVRPGVRIGTTSWQGLLVVPGGQVEPTAVEAAVVMTSLSPVSGLFTVTEKVMTADAPGVRFPVQVRTGAV
jgi:hypothetical protein